MLLVIVSKCMYTCGRVLLRHAYLASSQNRIHTSYCSYTMHVCRHCAEYSVNNYLINLLAANFCNEIQFSCANW